MHEPFKQYSLKPTHAGGVVYKMKNDSAWYLLISPKSNRDEWVLPKGHIDPGENEEQAALREVREETGVVARVVCPVKRVQFTVKGAAIIASFYLMELLSETGASEGRRMEWLPLDAAMKAATHPETQQLILAADRARRDAFNKRL
jgi:8-oxo-dGTP pyrophosphatase MutT (NUDIX family)